MYPREDRGRILADLEESGMLPGAFARSRPGSPSASTLRRWARQAEEGLLEVPRREVRGRAEGRPRHGRYPGETVAEAVRLVSGGARPADVARRLGVSSGGLVRSWCRRAAGAGRTPWRGAVRMGGPAEDRIAELEAELAEERMRCAALRELMRDPKAGDPASLSNSRKAELGERLRRGCGYRLRDVLTLLRISKSSYEYARRANEARGERSERVARRVRRAWEASGRTYGYRRVWASVRSGADGLPPEGVSQLEARRAMRAAGISGRRPRAGRPWSSYAGETDDRPANAPRERAAARRAAGEDFRLAHDFSAPAPGELAVTDVTEFSIPAGKVYLSPVIDCFDGAPAAWSISRHPDSALCDGSLRAYLDGLPAGSAPTVHTDGGATYRSASWKAIAGERGAARSMSRKACCQDNARAEGFFGTLKEEFFYGRDWSGASLAAFEEELDGYLRWYATGRLKAFREGGRTVYDTIAGRRGRLGYAT